MELMKKNKLIEYPLPNYLPVFDNLKLLDFTPYCISFQNRVDVNGFGRYGFDSEIGEKCISYIFGDIYFETENKLFKLKGAPKRNDVLYFYPTDDVIKSLIEQKIRYTQSIKKHELLLKQGEVLLDLPPEPLLSNLLSTNKLFRVDIINQLISQNISFFLQRFYSPEGGNTLILFDKKIREGIKEYCLVNDIFFDKKDSINELKAW